ncbi:site-specific integrase [Bacillus cereus]|nr:site-specific integrase [Bacillus cereus]
MRYEKLGEIKAGFKDYEIISFEHIEGTFCNFKLKVRMDGTVYDRIVYATYFMHTDTATKIDMDTVSGETFVDKTIILNMLHEQIKEKYEELRKPFRLKDITSGTDKKIEFAKLSYIEKIKSKPGYLKTFEDIPAAVEKIKLHNHNFKKYFIPLRKDHEKYIKTLKVAEKTKKTYADSLETFFKYLFEHKMDRLETYDENDINDFILHSVKKEKRKTSYLRKVMTTVFDYTRYKQRFLDKKKIEWIENKSKPTGIITKERLKEIEDQLYKKYVKVTSRMDFFPKLSKLRDGKRNYLLFKLLLELGCELEELILCNLEDVKEENGAKGIWINKRFVPMRQKTYELVERYVDFREEKDIQIEKEKWEIRYLSNRESNSVVSLAREHASPGAWDSYDAAVKKFEEEGTLNSEEANKTLSFLEFGACLNGISNYVDKTFVFDNSLFVSNRYKRISKVTCMEILRKLKVRSTTLREYAIQTFFHHGMELEDIIRLVGNMEGLKMDNYIIIEEKDKKKAQDIESDLPERNI